MSKTWLILRRLTVPGGEISWVCGAVEGEGEAKSQADLLNLDLRTILGCTIVSPDGKPQGTVRMLLQGIGVQGIAHARMAVEPKSNILVPEKGVLIQ